MSEQHTGLRAELFPLAPRIGRFLAILALCAGPSALAHSPNVDSSLRDWCVGAFTNTAPGGGRVEDRGVQLTCGRCDTGPTGANLACVVNSDCPTGVNCISPGSKTEVAWWDNRTDGAVNDLGTVVLTQDDSNLYIGAELWVDPDPVSLPFGQIAIDWRPGGLDVWHDPAGKLTLPGRCSVFTDRACTSNADCHFCMLSTEPFPSTRVRPCGSACDPGIGDVCQTNQTCVGLGVDGPKVRLGTLGGPMGRADHLVLFDFSFWLIGLGDAVQLMQPGAGTSWTPVLGCTPDFAGDTTACDFPPSVNPGQSGGSGGPPGSVEVAIPWSAFGCTGCPAACSCPGFGPGKPFRFTMTIARGVLQPPDFIPDGAFEDVMSEPIAGGSTTTTNSCAGFGIGNTLCELSDGSQDAFIPRAPILPHEVAAGGHLQSLKLTKAAGSAIRLDWFQSCSSADTDYEVYQGTLGTWYNHLPVPGLCLTGGTTATFVPGAASHYYLVVPTNGPAEGSYGLDGALVERPDSTAACVIQTLGTCP